MLDPSGGSGNGGTNWYGRSVPDMWTAMANQQTDNHWTLLTGWRKSYELTLQHMSAVRNYRDNLAAAWPPERSAASAAYLQRLDDLWPTCSRPTTPRWPTTAPSPRRRWPWTRRGMS